MNSSLRSDASNKSNQDVPKSKHVEIRSEVEMNGSFAEAYSKKSSTTHKATTNSMRHRKSEVHLPRLVNRDLPFHQSKNRLTVVNEKHHSHIWGLLMRDWFHVLLRLPAWFSTLMLLCVWTLVILIFAYVYTAIDQQFVNTDCGLGEPGNPISWGAAFAFSLETCTTVGCK